MKRFAFDAVERFASMKLINLAQPKAVKLFGEGDDRLFTS